VNHLPVISAILVILNDYEPIGFIFLTPLAGLLERFQNVFRAFSERFQMAGEVYPFLIVANIFAFIQARSCLGILLLDLNNIQ